MADKLSAPSHLGGKTPARSRRRIPAAERMGLIVESVITVLAAGGVEGLTIAEVARAAGVSPALVMLHFRTKEALLDETVRVLGTEYFASLTKAAKSAGPRAADRLWAMVEAEFTEPICTPRNLSAWRSIWAAPSGRLPYMRLFRAQTLGVFNDLLEMCRAIIDEGRYPDRDARTVARLIDSSLAGLWIDITDRTLPLTLNEARRIALAQLVIFFPDHFSAQGPRSRRVKPAESA